MCNSNIKNKILGVGSLKFYSFLKIQWNQETLKKFKQINLF